MDKLISADALCSTMKDDSSINGANLRRVIQHINDAPAVDAVVHGQWKVYPDFRQIICTNCLREFSLMHISYTRNYCPNCGAKMDEFEKGGAKMDGDGNEP